MLALRSSYLKTFTIVQCVKRRRHVQTEAGSTGAGGDAPGVNGGPLLGVLAEQAQVCGGSWCHAPRRRQRDEGRVRAQLLHADAAPRDIWSAAALGTLGATARRYG